MVYLFGMNFIVSQAFAGNSRPFNYIIESTGFSRGAYQIRALAGMIEKVGLFLVCEWTKTLTFDTRLESFTRITRLRYHCK